MEVYLEKMMERFEFWRIKDNLEKHFLYCHHWSDDKWKKRMARGGGNKKIYQYCIDSSGAIFYLRALPIPFRTPVSLILLNRTMLLFRTASSSTFIMSDVQSIHIPSSNSGLIPGGQDLSNRQTAFFLLVDILWTKNIKILMRST